MMKDRALVSIDRPLQDSGSPERGLNYQDHVQGSGTVLCLSPRGHPVLGFYSGLWTGSVALLSQDSFLGTHMSSGCLTVRRLQRAGGMQFTEMQNGMSRIPTASCDAFNS